MINNLLVLSFIVLRFVLYILLSKSIDIFTGIFVTYNYSKSVLHGKEDYGYETYEFKLDPDERIIRITARSGVMIDSLKFTTSKGNIYGPYGGLGGSLVELEAAGLTGYLTHMKGTVDVTQDLAVVRNLQFAWVYHVRDEPMVYAYRRHNEVDEFEYDKRSFDFRNNDDDDVDYYAHDLEDEFDLDDDDDDDDGVPWV